MDESGRWAADAVVYSARKVDHTTMETVWDEDTTAKALTALGLAIRTMRTEQGVSQEELSHRAHLDRSHMGRIERGERNVSFGNLIRISTGLNCKPSELFSRAGL